MCERQVITLVLILKHTSPGRVGSYFIWITLVMYLDSKITVTSKVWFLSSVLSTISSSAT